MLDHRGLLPPHGRVAVPGAAGPLTIARGRSRPSPRLRRPCREDAGRISGSQHPSSRESTASTLPQPGAFRREPRLDRGAVPSHTPRGAWPRHLTALYFSCGGRENGVKGCRGASAPEWGYRHPVQGQPEYCGFPSQGSGQVCAPRGARRTKMAAGRGERSGHSFATSPAADDGPCQEAAVPVYAYRCLDCGEVFEKVEHMVDHDQGKHPPCPCCNGERVAQVFAPFFAKTHKKS